MILTNTAVVDAMTEGQLRFVIAHEVAHELLRDAEFAFYNGGRSLEEMRDMKSRLEDSCDAFAVLIVKGMSGNLDDILPVLPKLDELDRSGKIQSEKFRSELENPYRKDADRLNFLNEQYGKTDIQLIDEFYGPWKSFLNSNKKRLKVLTQQEIERKIDEISNNSTAIAQIDPVRMNGVDGHDVIFENGTELMIARVSNKYTHYTQVIFTVGQARFMLNPGGMDDEYYIAFRKENAVGFVTFKDLPSRWGLGTVGGYLNDEAKAFLPQAGPDGSWQERNHAMSSVKRILVLDNEEVLAVANAEVLRQEGYIVEEALSLAEARDKILTAKEPFDLVVSDIDLGPDRRGRQRYGWELAQEFKNIPFIVITGHPRSLSEIKANAPDGKIVAHMAKPIKYGDLISTVKRVSEELGSAPNVQTGEPKRNPAMSAKDILKAYFEGDLNDNQVVAAFLKGQNIDPKELDSAIEEAGKEILRAKLKDPNHPLVKFAAGTQSVVYKGTVEGNDIIVKSVADPEIWSKYADYQDRLGHNGFSLAAGYFVFKDLDINVDGHIIRIPNAVVQEEVVTLLDRVRDLRKIYQADPDAFHREIDNLLNDYFEMYKKLLTQGFVMKPNGFLVDVGLTKGNNRAVVLDVGDLLTKEEAADHGYDLEHFDHGFILALQGHAIFSRITPQGRKAEVIDALAELNSTDNNFNYTIVQNAERDFADRKVLELLAQKPKKSRELYFGNYKIRQDIENARLDLINRRLPQPALENIVENGGPKVNSAQLTENQLVDQSLKRRGGIDLTAGNLNLLTLNSSGGIKFHMDPAMLQRLQNAPGFVPVIINIQPMTDLRLFLGLGNNSSSPVTSG